MDFNSSNTIIYTALIGQNEGLNSQPFIKDSNLRHVCLTDDPNLTSNQWEIINVNRILPLDAHRSQRNYKIRPHLIFPEYKYSFYFDNTVVLKCKSETFIEEVFAKYVSNENEPFIILPYHSYRDNLISEFYECFISNLDSDLNFFEQISDYLSIDILAMKSKPYWCGILFRNHSHQKIRDFSEIWYSHILKYSRRDQLSIIYAGLQLGLKFAAIKIDNFSTKYHEWPITNNERKSRIFKNNIYELPSEFLKNFVSKFSSTDQEILKIDLNKELSEIKSNFKKSFKEFQETKNQINVLKKEQDILKSDNKRLISDLEAIRNSKIWRYAFRCRKLLRNFKSIFTFYDSKSSPPKSLNTDLELLNYIASHPDLIKVFRTDLGSAKKHFMEFGYKEKRRLTFNTKQYLANYGDLADFFCAKNGFKTTDLVNEGALKHFINFGYEEGRTDAVITFKKNLIIKLIKKSEKLGLKLKLTSLSKFTIGRLIVDLILFPSDVYKVFYYCKKTLGIFPNIIFPKTFNENLHSRKLFNRRKLYTILADKLAVRNYVEDKIGKEYLNKLIWSGSSIRDLIDKEKLPNKFVIKTNNGSGTNFICKDKSKFNWDFAALKTDNWLKNDHSINFAEWQYRWIKPKVLIEEFMEDNNGKLIDYKFFCFGGKAKLIDIQYDRFSSEHKRQLLDENFNFVDVEYNEIKTIKGMLPCQEDLILMKNLAEKLSKGIDFVCVDLYLPDKIVFGELTLHPAAGHGKFVPKSFDLELGKEFNN